MQKDSAKNLIQDTLQSSFNKERFIYLTKNILNHIEDAPFVYKGNFIFDDFADSIKTLERIGKYKDPEGKLIDIIIVRLKKETTLERARTKQRNFIAKYLKGSRGGVLKDAALAAFVSPNNEDWRFSLVKMEYKFNDKGKVEEEFTPARRYSFLVGKNEKSHTAQSRLLPLLLNDEVNPTLAELEETFSVERVTKEFFEKYRELFIQLKESLDDIVKKDPKIYEEFEKKNVNKVDFAKKLLGQIVFLYFLQKKGWFGVERDKEWGSGSKHFLRELFEKKHGNYKNFFNDILEPLFYEALRLERPGDYYSRFNCRIPFLNGGLFDPLGDYDWWNTDILLPNDLFSNNRKTKEGDIGDGILDIFDRYNFTVKEDEPLEKEVAVDPEMLGKVFENLLEVKDRKSKGTYYTPREIVHYMCQESLVNYLATELEGKTSKEDIETLIKYGEAVVEHDSRVASEGCETERYSFKLPQSVRKHAKLIDEKLASICVCDPAVGSGAFPVGMMNEIIRTRKALTAYIGEDGERTPYHLKRHAIQNCLYGVDIDPGAVEIAKLRLWLSLVVDEEERDQIQPLPNLDYKIMQGNSLVELVSYSTTNDPQRNQIVNEMKKLKDKLFNITSPEAKKKKRNEVEALIKQLFEYDRKKQIESLKQKIQAIKSQGRLFEDKRAQKDDENKIKALEAKIQEIKNIKVPGPEDHFEWHINFSEVFHEKKGFDVVIANPPYVKEYVNRSAFNGLRDSPYYQGKMDLWYMFACKGIDVLKHNGVLTFIAQNNWVTSYGASKMRNKVIKDTQILSLVDFGAFRIFEAGIQTMVMIFQRSTKKGNYSFDCRRLVGNDLDIKDVIALLNNESSVETEYLTPKIDRTFLIDKPLTFNSSDVQQVLEEILKKSNFRLDPIKEVAQGIVTPQDCVNKASQKVLGENFKVGYGIFTLSTNELKALKLSKNEQQLIRPFYTSEELNKWWTDSKNQRWVIYTDSSFKDKKKIEKFPNIKKHLDQFEKVITSDNKPYGLHRARDEKFFKGEKIIAVRKCARPSFSYVDFDSYVSATFYIIKTNRINQKYLTALLNSRLIEFWLRHKGKMQGTNFQIDKEPLVNLPLVKPDQGAQKKLANIVDKILAITKDDDYLENPAKQAKVREYEKQIDQLVYKLYGLTAEEIKIVEESQS